MNEVLLNCTGHELDIRRSLISSLTRSTDKGCNCFVCMLVSWSVIALCVCMSLDRFNCQLHCQQLFRQWLFSTVTICCWSVPFYLQRCWLLSNLSCWSWQVWLAVAPTAVMKTWDAQSVWPNRPWSMGWEPRVPSLSHLVQNRSVPPSREMAWYVYLIFYLFNWDLYEENLGHHKSLAPSQSAIKVLNVRILKSWLRLRVACW